MTDEERGGHTGLSPISHGLLRGRSGSLSSYERKHTVPVTEVSSYVICQSVKK